MEIGIIAPTNLIKKYCLTNIQYVYPSLFKTDEDYAVFHLQKRWEEYDNTITIVDCSRPGWKRVPESLLNCLPAIRELQPHYIITPSYTYDIKKTLEIEEAFKESILSASEDSVLVPCLEGIKLEDIIECYNLRKNFIVAIPQTTASYGKADLARASLRGVKKYIYLDHYTKLTDIEPRHNDFVISSLPLRQGLQGRLLTDPNPPPLTLDLRPQEDKYPDIVKYNLREMVNYYA